MDYGKYLFLLMRVRWFSLNMPWLVLLVCPTFMLGIWHGGEWIKRDLAQQIYDLVEHGSPMSSLFIAFINKKFIPLISCVNVLMYMWILWLICL